MNNGQLGTVYKASGKLYLRYIGEDGSKRSVFLCPAKGEGKLSKAQLEKRKLEILKSAGLTGEMPEEMKQGITFNSSCCALLGARFHCHHHNLLGGQLETDTRLLCPLPTQFQAFLHLGVAVSDGLLLLLSQNITKSSDTPSERRCVALNRRNA